MEFREYCFELSIDIRILSFAKLNELFDINNLVPDKSGNKLNELELGCCTIYQSIGSNRSL